MWYKIYGQETIDSLKEGDKLLNHPTHEGQRYLDPTGEEKNSQIYKINELHADTVVVFPIGNALGYEPTMTKAIFRKDLLASNWFWWMEE